MHAEQEKAFWDTIEVFDKQGLLPYIMVIGSWAEYIYMDYFKTGYESGMKTRDLDFLYRNIRRPESKISIIPELTKNGFTYSVDILTGVGKFYKEGLLEVEFLTKSIGKGSSTMKIPSLGITAESLRTINLLADFPLDIECNNYVVTVPEPAAYVLQKLYTNPTRRADKREKDIRAIKLLLPHIKSSEYESARLNLILNSLHKNHQKIIMETCENNFIEL
jgi:hypothetical protein